MSPFGATVYVVDEAFMVCTGQTAKSSSFSRSAGCIRLASLSCPGLSVPALWSEFERLQPYASGAFLSDLILAIHKLS